MGRLRNTMQNNVRILRSRVTKHAIYGTLIAVFALIFATILSCYFQYGEISFGNIIKTQKTNVTLWFLNAMPFIFAFWGQYTSSIMAYEAGTMVADQTSDLRDLTVALEHKVSHEATHDSVTELPNRVLLLDRLDQAIQGASRTKDTLALLILDIDDFKDINDTLGHFNGDRLLKQMVSRLHGGIRKSDTLARVGGDEFAMLLNTKTEQEHIQKIVEKIKKIFLEPFSLDGLALEIQVSIGVAFYPEHGKEVDSIMQRANVALEAAKQDTNKYTIYSSDLDRHNPHRLTMMGELRQAIENDELMVYYQPKVDLKTSRICGAEALVRWQHPEHGFMPPDEFIPMAERTGLIKPLSIWVMNQALSQAEQWHRQKLKINIAINLSPTTLLDPEFPNMIIGILSSYDVPPEYVTLEVTEGSMIKNPELAMEILHRLSEMNIKISIDDFGTGYSSMAYLKDLPVSEIKIDKSFVLDMLSNERDAVIVKSIIDIGHNLGLYVTAEGVEDKQTGLRLKELGCDILQGYYFSKPCPNDQFMAWIKQKISKSKRAGSTLQTSAVSSY